MPRIAYKKKRFGEQRQEIIRLANTVLEQYAAQGYELTLRQLYYQFVARGWLPNKAESYNLLGGVVNDARMAGLIDWSHIVDRTRNIKENPHFDGPAAAVQSLTRWFETDKWEDQPVRPEVWIEKDALIGVIEGPCRDLDITYFACRGYVSQSEMWEASNRLRKYIEAGQKTVVFYFGDHDPSGIDMTRDVEDRLWTFISGDYWRSHPEYSAVNVEVTIDSAFRVERVALNMDQIEQYKPPPNPAKITDSRAKDYIEKYGRESWELDALEPSTISDLIYASVWGVMDEELMLAAKRQQAAYIDELSLVAEDWHKALKGVKA